jgi:hypothetical protein
MDVIINDPKVAELYLQYLAERKITTVEAGNSIALSCAELGKDIETGDPVYIGDNERYGGFYILGEPRTGKSEYVPGV